MKKLFLLLGALTFNNAQAMQIPAPAYLSDPNFPLCKKICPQINHGSWSGLDIDCINDCLSTLSDECELGD